MIELKTLSIAAAASAALLGFTSGSVSADAAKAPLQLAQASGSTNPQSGRDTNSGTVAVPQPGKGSSSGASSMGTGQCAQISDPRARQDCMQRENDLRSGSGASGNDTGNRGANPGVTNRGTGPK